MATDRNVFAMVNAVDVAEMIRFHYRTATGHTADVLSRLAYDFADQFEANTGDRFDYDRFMAACGIGREEN